MRENESSFTNSALNTLEKAGAYVAIAGLGMWGLGWVGLARVAAIGRGAAIAGGIIWGGSKLAKGV